MRTAKLRQETIMSDKYIAGEIEPKWQAVWEERGLYKTQEEPDKPKW